MKVAVFKKIEVVFWVIYVLFPIFTDLFVYQPLPDEYNETKHELLESHFEEVGPEGLNSAEVPDAWRDRQSGRVFTADMFVDYRRSQARFRGIKFLGYSVIGCLAFAYGRFIREKSGFISAFKKALAVAIAISFIVFLVG